MPKIKDPTPDKKVRLRGLVNLPLLAGVIGAILLSASWRPGISFRVHGVELELQNLAARRHHGRHGAFVAGAQPQGTPRRERFRMGADRRGGEAVRRHLRLHHPGDSPCCTPASRARLRRWSRW